ncbi:MAG TPA: ABC transporter ATP-binding protein [Acidimicrobiales bacterium]|nr:ABC transporter ATP-binding protein [Acidimicrobiales bacterium]
MSADAARVRLEGVGVDLDGATVLDGIDLAVADGEVLAVLGASGSGKSTLLRVIAGLQMPTRGRVLLDGVDVTRRPPHRRDVGLMFQEHALFPHRDVAANVGFGLRMRGAGRDEIAARVAEVLDLVGLRGFDHRDVASLSGGERQRVALARALAPDPAVVLLDEPLGALDRALRERLLDDLVAVLERARATVLYVTHDRSEAFSAADRVALVRAGRLVQVGTPHELWWHPADVDVARFVGPAAVVPVEVDADGVVRAPWGRVDGVLGQGAGVDAVGAGPASLVLRPDAVALVDADRAAAIRGRVVDRGFHGDHDRVRVRLDADGTEVEVAVRGLAAPGIGEAVGVVVRPEVAMVLPPVGHHGGP